MNDAADAHKSKAAGALQVDAVKPKTLADGLQAKMGNLTWVSLSLSLRLIHWIPWNASDNLLCLPLSASSGNFVIATLFEKAVVRDLVDDVVVVEEAEIVSAMQLVYERMKVVVEPSGAVGVAAALGGDGRKVSTAKFPQGRGRTVRRERRFLCRRLLGQLDQAMAVLLKQHSRSPIYYTTREGFAVTLHSSSTARVPTLSCTRGSPAGRPRPEGTAS